MCVQIRDAKFVIADLTHGNDGAYWEAGYAEGLGKPVAYICEKEEFKKRATLIRITARPFSGLSLGIMTRISVRN